MILFSLPAFGQLERKKQSIDSLSNGGASGGGGGPPAPTYLIMQDFEGSGYDNSETWTESGAGIDEDYTGIILDGSESLRIAFTNSNVMTTSPDFADQAEVWVYMMFRPVVIDNAFRNTILRLRTSGGSIQAQVAVETDNTIRIAMDGAAFTVDTVSAGTTYHLWAHYLKGTGADAIFEVGISTDGTKPTSGDSFVSITDGDRTTDCAKIDIKINSGVRTETYIFDKVRVDDEEIGEDPP